MGVLVIPEGKTALSRISVFIGLATVVATIIYLTPIPEQYPQSCARHCHELDWPMICRMKLTLERYRSLGSACKNCPLNQTACNDKHCVTADGHVRGMLTANRQFPGPSFQVCQHDIIVVDVVNRVSGRSVGVHWRGQSQAETPYMDGVPMITQCPIPSFTTFQYKFRASESGSHMWQVNTGEEISDTLFGPMIVRKPDSKEIHRRYYDTDDPDHVVVIHSWDFQKETIFYDGNRSKMKILINGKIQENGVPPSVFTVLPGKRHRFRVLYAGSARSCAVRLTIDNHALLVIALDGHPIEPKTVNTVELFPGERLDFVLTADQKISAYHLTAAVETCSFPASVFAVIKYEDMVPHSRPSLNSAALEFSELKTSFGEACGTDEKKGPNYCLQNIRSVEKIPEKLAGSNPDAKFYFFYSLGLTSKRDDLVTFLGGGGDTVKVPQANNITMMLPSYPLLSQSHEVHEKPDFCQNSSIPQRCKGADVCECIHIVDVPLNGVVELVLINLDSTIHVFHLHGYSFRVIGAEKLPSGLTRKEIKSLDEAGKLVKRNFIFPVIKDTVAVVNNSVVVLRFKADNPGYWYLDEEQSSFWFKGMSVVLHVGETSDLAPVPQNFPKCGDWIGPEYFFA